MTIWLNNCTQLSKDFKKKNKTDLSCCFCVFGAAAPGAGVVDDVVVVVDVVAGHNASKKSRWKRSTFI